jgi:hypothetical protein
MAKTKIICAVVSVVILASIAPQSVISAPDDCAIPELVLYSAVVTGQVVVSSNGRERPAAKAEIEMFENRGDGWQSIGKIWAIDKGYFTWLAVEPGKYLLVAKLDGYQTTKLYLQVKGRKGRERRIVVPLRNDGCAIARLKA